MSAWEDDLNKQFCYCASKRYIQKYYPFNDDTMTADSLKENLKKIASACRTEVLLRAAEESLN